MTAYSERLQGRLARSADLEISSADSLSHICTDLATSFGKQAAAFEEVRMDRAEHGLDSQSLGSMACTKFGRFFEIQAEQFKTLSTQMSGLPSFLFTMIQEDVTKHMKSLKNSLFDGTGVMNEQTALLSLDLVDEFVSNGSMTLPNSTDMSHLREGLLKVMRYQKAIQDTELSALSEPACIRRALSRAMELHEKYPSLLEKATARGNDHGASVSTVKNQSSG